MHENLRFFMISWPKMAVYWSKIELFGFRQSFEDPPPYVEGAGCERAGFEGTQITKKLIYSMPMHQNLPFFMKKRPKMAVFGSKVEFFWPQISS